MRMALEMFTTFLVSGATDVDKMLAIYNREGAYFVAFHEFVKSIMLGDRKYYKESESPVMNLYDCGADRNSSHSLHFGSSRSCCRGAVRVQEKDRVIVKWLEWSPFSKTYSATARMSCGRSTGYSIGN